VELKKLIRDIPNFPQPGIIFRDISPLLKSGEALDFVAKEFERKLVFKNIEYFAGIESIGFILATLLAAKFNRGFLPLRKKGKLPPPTIDESYDLEYGSASLEVNPGKGNVIILDDVLATGGTLNAAIRLCERGGYQVQNVAVLINLRFLNKMTFNEKEITSLVQYE
jgi:adenine phosphoribosyltransferase